MPPGSRLIEKALTRPSGARFYRCALQVNPFEYAQRHSKGTKIANEEKYNTALLKAFEEHGVEVIAITDHYRVKSGASLGQAARARGLRVFRGFEAATKEG